MPVLRTSSQYTTCKYSLPAWHHIIFLSILCIEAAIKITGLGFAGGKFAWFTHDFFNKMDIIALAAYCYETGNAMAGGTSNFSLRGFRLMRLLKPVGQLGVFSDLQTIFHAFGMALTPMATVLLFIWFVLILFGIMGMAVWGKSSFRRRCVWADTLQVKSPEMFCKRDEYFLEYPGCIALLGENVECAPNPVPPSERKGTPAEESDVPLALPSNCGPLQLCLDVGNPNAGFGSFDHLPAAMLTLFRVMSGDGDILVLWYAIQSEPSLRLLTSAYFIGFAFLVIHVLINVFVAVFANIFADSRVSHEELIEMRRKGMVRDDGGSYSSRASSRGPVSSSGQPEAHFSSIDERESNEDQERANAYSGARATIQKQVDLLKKKEEAAQAATMQRRYVGSTQWLYLNLARPVDPSLQHFTVLWFRDNDIYDTLCFLVTLAQGISLAMVGQLCSQSDCSWDHLFADIVQYSNIFFITDLILQVLCDGSVARHFESGENIFNALVTFVTTLGLILPLLGLPIQTVETFRGFAIFRLLRMCKYFFLKPIWLMLIKAAGALVSVMNLCIFNTLCTIVWYTIGRSLFKGSLDENVRFNYSSISRGYMTLLTVMTGDGWSDLMYQAMAVFCDGEGVTDVCDNFYVTLAALYYMFCFFYGQFLFITMFLAIILEAFAVEEFMTAGISEDDEKLLDEEEARAHGQSHVHETPHVVGSDQGTRVLFPGLLVFIGSLRTVDCSGDLAATLSRQRCSKRDPQPGIAMRIEECWMQSALEKCLNALERL